MSKSITRLIVEVDEQTMQLLHREAQENARSLDEVIQAAIGAYIRELSVLPDIAGGVQERRDRIRQEATAWRSLPEAERKRYGDVFVAVRNGQVIDTDANRLTLLQRIRKQYTHEAVLITSAAADGPREFSHVGLRRS